MRRGGDSERGAIGPALPQRAGRVWRALAARRNEALIILAVATFMSIAGPNAQYSGLWFGYRWLYWVVLVAFGWLVGGHTALLVDRLFKDPPTWVHLVVDPLIIAVAITAVLAGMQALVGRPLPWAYLPGTYFIVWVVSVGITGVAFLASRAFNAPAAPAVAAASGDAAGPLDHRLPRHLHGARVLAAVSEDHYLRVFTTRGEALILMRLADAERALETQDGMRIHRSWWVARSAVDAVERANGKIALRLSVGRTAPVSRTYAGALREAGWL